MKTFVISSLVMLLSLYAHAQAFRDSLDYAQHVLTLKKKAAVLKEIPLTEAEKSAFWPVFDSFERAIKNYEIESLYLLSKYTRKGDAFTDKDFYNFSKCLLENDLAIAKLRQRYFKKIRHALSTEQASAFMQLDENFRSAARKGVQKDDPSSLLALNTRD